MTDLPVEEREAMEAAGRRIEGDAGSVGGRYIANEGWMAAREYSKQREEKLREALETIELSVPGLHAPEPRWRRFAESLQEIARAALAKNGEGQSDSVRNRLVVRRTDGGLQVTFEEKHPDGLGDRRPGA